MQLGPRGPGAHTWTAPQQAPWPHPALKALLGVLPAPSWGFCQAGGPLPSSHLLSPSGIGEVVNYHKGQRPLRNANLDLSRFRPLRVTAGWRLCPSLR